MSAIDEDALFASLDVIRRAGASSTEFGFLNDDVAVEDADWWAHAQYRGRRVMVEHRHGPVEAVEALARKLMHGAACRRCGKVISLTGELPKNPEKAKVCRWQRVGRKWEPGCGLPINHSIQPVR